MALHHSQNLGFRTQAEKMYRSIFGAHGHQLTAFVVKHTMGVLAVTQAEAFSSVASVDKVTLAFLKQEVTLTRQTPLWCSRGCSKRFVLPSAQAWSPRRHKNSQIAQTVKSIKTFFSDGL